MTSLNNIWFTKNTRTLTPEEWFSGNLIAKMSGVKANAKRKHEETSERKYLHGRDSPSMYIQTSTPPKASKASKASKAPKQTKQTTLEATLKVAPVASTVVIDKKLPLKPEEIKGKAVVDLFCGLGGFSQGAVDAGHTVVLCVDSWSEVLRAHAANHPHAVHVQMELGDENESRLVQLIEKYVPPGVEWHLHGSPPCQKLSRIRAISNGINPEMGLELVSWYVRLTERLKPTTWTMEQVSAPELRGMFQYVQYMRPETFDWQHCWMELYGVPQTRHRALAGSPSIIERLRHDKSLRADAPLVTDVLVGAHKPPKEAVYLRASIGMTPKNGSTGRQGDVKPIDTVAYTCTSRHPHAWLDKNYCHIRELNPQEQLILQSFSPDVYLPDKINDAITAIGNAIPPLFVKKIMRV